MHCFTSCCTCSAVCTQFTLPITMVVECHCHLCRRMQGARSMHWVAVANDQFKITKGRNDISHYAINSRSNKYFCRHCGCTVFGENGKHFKGHKTIPLGTIEHYNTAFTTQHIVYQESAVSWHSECEN